ARGVPLRLAAPADRLGSVEVGVRHGTIESRSAPGDLSAGARGPPAQQVPARASCDGGNCRTAAAVHGKRRGWRGALVDSAGRALLSVAVIAAARPQLGARRV